MYKLYGIIMKMIFIKEVSNIVKRNTKQKEEIIKFLENNDNIHLSVSDIQEGTNNLVGLTTTYRILNDLSKDGILIKHRLENNQGFCYQYNKDKYCLKKHYHLICEICNKVIHYENNKLEKLCMAINNEYDFNIRVDKLVFYGICNKCKEREKVC